MLSGMIYKLSIFLRKDRLPIANRTRAIILILAVTECEKQLIEDKMKQFGTRNMKCMLGKSLLITIYSKWTISKKTRGRC